MQTTNRATILTILNNLDTHEFKTITIQNDEFQYHIDKLIDHDRTVTYYLTVTSLTDGLGIPHFVFMDDILKFVENEQIILKME